MTSSEYQQLVEFFGRRFAEIDQHFEAVDCRFDAVEAKLAEHDERFRDILAHFDQLYRRLERLEPGPIFQAVRQIEVLLTDRRPVSNS